MFIIGTPSSFALIAFIRTAVITLDIDDHHIAVLGKPFVAFLYRRFVMALPKFAFLV